MGFTSKGLPMLVIVVFVAVMLSPVWMGMAGKADTPKPEITKELKAEGKKCVRSASWMRANHMQLLDEWRDEVVRDSDRDDVYMGIHTDKSLSRTCMKCHDNKKNFCDRCHAYASVEPFCWTCHVEPKEKLEPKEKK